MTKAPSRSRSLPPLDVQRDVAEMGKLLLLIKEQQPGRYPQVLRDLRKLLRNPAPPETQITLSPKR